MFRVNILMLYYIRIFLKKHYITIPAESSNPIKEHEITILDRLDEERVIGRGAGFGKKQLKGYIIN